MSLRTYETVLKAVADPTRARILKILEGGELCVCQIIAVLPLGQSTISKHLFLLRNAGLIRDRRDRKWIYYSLVRKGGSPFALRLLRNIREWLEDDPVIVQDRERSALARSIGPVAICERRMKLPSASRDLLPARWGRSTSRKRGKRNPGPKASPAMRETPTR